MHNVDTISLGLDFRKRITDSKYGWKWVCNMNAKIISKLKLFKEDAEVRNKLKEQINPKNLNDFLIRIQYNKHHCYYWHGACNLLIFTYNEIWQHLQIFIPHEIVAPKTSDELEQYVRKQVLNFFEISAEDLPPLKLMRIDIKNDYRYENSEELDIIKNIIQKAPDNIYSYKKRNLRNDKDGYVTKYISKKSTPLKQSNTEIIIRIKKESNDFSDNSYECNKDTGNYEEMINYDKDKEILEKFKKKEISEEYLEIYKNIFRTEFRIKNSKLNSMISQNIVKDKELKNFYNFEMTSNLYNNFVTKIFGTNNFYRIDEAVRLVNHSTDLLPKTKASLTDLLININQLGYSNASKKWIKEKSKSSFHYNINILKNLSINPLTFDEYINNNKVSKKYIQNFTSLANGVEDYFEHHKAFEVPNMCK